MTKKDKLIEAKNKIMRSMNFEKIHAYMKLTNWKWQSYCTESLSAPTVPNIQSIQLHAESLLNTVINEKSKTYYATSGGFFACKFDNELHLHFVIEEKTIETTNKGKLHE